MAAIAMNIESDEIELTCSMVIEFIDSANTEEMAEILKATGKRATFLMKNGGKVSKRVVTKGVVPTGFAKNPLWVEFVKGYVAIHGWDGFLMKTKEGLVEMEGSTVTMEGTFVFPSTGKPLSHPQAVGLAKHLKDTSSAVYIEYKESESESSVPVAVASKPAVARISQAEMDAKKAEKEAAKAAEKAAKDAAKAIEKAAKEEAKALAKAAEKAEKEAAKAAEKAAKEAALAPRKAIVVKRVGSPSPQPAATVMAQPIAPVRPLPKAVVAVEVAKVEAKVAAAKAVVKVAAAPKKVKEWVTPAEGSAGKWEHNGTKYVRDWRNAVWLRGKNGEYGAWVGMYDEETDEIDESAEDPDVVAARENAPKTPSEVEEVVEEDDDE
jgi:chemotaxis protein histidine kinase CheA